MWQTSLALLSEKRLSGRAATALQNFVDLVFKLQEEAREQPLEGVADIAIKRSGLHAMYQAEKGEKAQARLENLEELVSACKQFEMPDDVDNMSMLDGFLAHASLEAGESQADSHQDAVQLMTIHTAKGLEFPMVFLAGVEEGMFPSQQSYEEPGRLEEERRLCYVGMTRAMRKLFISYAETRRVYGQDKYHTASRFIKEMPGDCIEEIRLRNEIKRPVHNRFSGSTSLDTFDETGFALGGQVLHQKFGTGTVLNYEGSGPQARVQVNFDDYGTKWLVLSYAKLTKL